MDPLNAQDEYDKKSPYYKTIDVFSYCVVASEVLTGEQVPRITKLIELTQRKTNPRHPFPDFIPDTLRNYLTSGFDERPHKRATWDQLISALTQAKKLL